MGVLVSSSSSSPPQNFTGGGRPSKKPKKKHASAHTVAEEIILYSICPRLPCKSLRRFTSVCKSWNTLISGGDDALFARLSPHCNITSKPNHPDAAVVMLNATHEFQVIPALAKRPADIPATLSPLPRFESCLLVSDHTVLVLDIGASANGFLCLLCGEGYFGPPFLYLCNPATKEPGHRIPIPYPSHPSTNSLMNNIGLAFTPPTLTSESLESCNYLLVSPLIDHRSSTCQCQFKVFSSRNPSQGWIMSSNEVLNLSEDHKLWPPRKSVSTRRCMYWNCIHYLIYFRYCDDRRSLVTVGHIETPQWSAWDEFSCHQEIGVCGDSITLAQLCDFSLNLWVLRDEVKDNQSSWEQIYRVSLECVVGPKIHSFFKIMSRLLKSKGRTIQYRGKGCKMRLLPYQGGSIVLFELIRANPENKHGLGTFFEECGQSFLLLSFDMKSGEITDIFNDLSRVERRYFGYTKNLTPMEN